MGSPDDFVRSSDSDSESGLDSGSDSGSNSNMNSKRQRESESPEISERARKKFIRDSPPPKQLLTFDDCPEPGKKTHILYQTKGITVSKALSWQVEFRARAKEYNHPDQHIAKYEAVLRSTDHPTIDYVGCEDAAGKLGSYQLYGVAPEYVDEELGITKLYPARVVTLKAYVRAQQAPPEAMTEKGRSTNMRESRNDLIDTFGTKKAKKAIATISNNAIAPSVKPEPSDDMQTQKLSATDSAILGSLAADVKEIATREELQAAVDEGKPRPKANLDAESVEDVYKAESIVGADILKMIPVKEWQDKLKKHEEVIIESRYVARRLQRSVNNVLKLKILQYMFYLIKLLRHSTQKGNMRVLPKVLPEKFLGPQKLVVEKIKTKYYTAGRMNKFQLDFFIATICVLALIVDDFRVNFQDLQEDLMLDAKNMGTYFREVGAQLVAPTEEEMRKLGLDKASAAKPKLAKLKLPLDFPQSRFVRAR